MIIKAKWPFAVLILAGIVLMFLAGYDIVFNKGYFQHIVAAYLVLIILAILLIVIPALTTPKPKELFEKVEEFNQRKSRKKLAILNALSAKLILP